MECCNKIYKFCESVQPCNFDELFDLIKTVFKVPGVYTLKLYFLDSCVEREINISVLEEFTLVDGDDTQILNENYFYKAKLFNLDGENVNIVDTYDCFSFKTKFCY
jgi:hypothetical protein